jgi:hypothetical protein
MAKTERQKFLSALSPLNAAKAEALESIMALLFTMMLEGYITAKTFRCCRDDLKETLAIRAPRAKKPAAKRKGKRT